MKRLLAYLIVVISLGLTFSVSANAKTSYCVAKNMNYPPSDNELLSKLRLHSKETLDLRVLKIKASSYYVKKFWLIKKKIISKHHDCGNKNEKYKLVTKSDFNKKFIPLFARLTELQKIIIDEQNVQRAKKEPKKKEKKVVKKELFGETKIVKNIKTKPLKTVKVDKTTSSDNQPPILTVVETLTVTDPRYTIEGKVTDKGSDKIYLKVDGQDVLINKGKFVINRYSPVDETIKITAIDKWGNEVTKIIKVSVNIENSSVAEVLEPLNASKIKTKSSNNKVALIIGIENYVEAPKANYANLDAKYFYDYARKAFGVKKQNINLLVDENATFVKTSKALTLWLKTKIKPNQTDLVIFFAGHGLASSNGKELYLLPQDSDPNLLDITALSRTKLFQTIIDLKPKSVTMFLDTCYSGVSRDEQMLLASARPIRITANEQEGIPDNFTIFSATELDQISSGLKEAKHGIFSYYLMKGLEGKADANKDKDITNGELLAYMDQNVAQKASELGRQQNPSLAGDPDKILMSYR